MICFVKILRTNKLRRSFQRHQPSFLGGTTPHTFLKTKMSPDKMLVGRWNVLLSPGPFSVDCFPFFLCVHFLFPPVSYQQKSWKLRKQKKTRPFLRRTAAPNQSWLLQVHLETTSLMGSTPLERRFGGLVGTNFPNLPLKTWAAFFGSSGPNHPIFEVRCCCFLGQSNH